MIVPFAMWDHYRDHLAPIVAALGDDAGVADPISSVALIAGYGDLVNARREGFSRFVMAQHGAGQSYSNRHSHYPGGDGNGDVGLFLVPNEHSATRWLKAYPKAAVAIVGCPKIETLPEREPGEWPVVAVAFHFDLFMVPESRSALPWYMGGLRDLGQRFKVIGTGHPKRSDLLRVYEWAGIEYVEDFADVCRRADVLAFDNTSVGFEFAATGRPVVVMDAPWYRRDVEHGLRFWDAAEVGIRVSDPTELIDGVVRALERRAEDVDRREHALNHVYAYRTGAAERAATAIRSWLS